MCRVFESAPAANRDSDSYKQPLLASSQAMIGSMRRQLWDSFIHQLKPPTHGTAL
jgi:hypothetical protein